MAENFYVHALITLHAFHSYSSLSSCIYLPPLLSPFSLFFFLQNVYKVGLEISGSIGYLIEIPVSTTLCDTYYAADASACFKAYGTTKGNIAVKAYSQRRTVRCKWHRGCRVSLTWMPTTFPLYYSSSLSHAYTGNLEK